MRYKARLRITRKAEVEFEGDFVRKDRPYRAAQMAAIEAAIDQGIVNPETDSVDADVWLENVRDTDTRMSDEQGDETV